MVSGAGAGVALFLADMVNSAKQAELRLRRLCAGGAPPSFAGILGDLQRTQGLRAVCGWDHNRACSAEQPNSYPVLANKSPSTWRDALLMGSLSRVGGRMAAL